MKTAKKQTTHAFSQFTLTNKLLQNLYKYKLTPTAKLVLLELSTCYNPKHGDMFPKQKTLANRIGISERSVVRAVSELVKEGLILIECKYTNHYKFSSRITSEWSENLSDDIKQSDTSNRDNLSLHEPIIEPINQHTGKVGDNVYSETDQILVDYAKKRGAKNIKAYIAKLKLNGSASKIIREQKNVQNVTQNALRNFQETQKLLEEYKNMRENTVSPETIPQLAKFRNKKALI